ncbi:Rrf2 family transcriptional regulator [Brevundimonas intermedia]|uniref:Rrf2 family transcriptional regulator n=1 Tax=Brevundimonas intermedia TaxID=74315 RepID=A0ABQ5T5H7_9CAUL|nr:Rrf2 family transcriptional regulator [Brevundimonas intermedia]GLK47658.1 Rrf2 family transcriptional regulator [Brevundimonas intermedia]
MKTRYGLQALIFLARRSPEPATSGVIAQGSEAPRKFLEAVLLELKLAGILKSRMGRSGGYELARAASKITMADVLRALDGPLALAPCAARKTPQTCPGCKDLRTCAIRPSLSEARVAVADVLEHRSIAHLAKVPSPLEEFS